MCKNRLTVLLNDQLVHWECNRVKEMADKWKKDFRDLNKTDHILNSGLQDRSYEMFCKQIDEFISHCESNS